MKTEYRNAIRSRELIKGAFIQLLNTKPLSKITVTEIVDQANVSRGTFYSHYRDLNQLMRSFRDDYIRRLHLTLEELNQENLADRVDSLIETAFEMIDEDFKTYQLLANQALTTQFLFDERKNLFDLLTTGVKTSVEERKTIKIYISVLVSYFMEWLIHPTDVDIVTITNTVSKQCHKMYD